MPATWSIDAGGVEEVEVEVGVEEEVEVEEGVETGVLHLYNCRSSRHNPHHPSPSPPPHQVKNEEEGEKSEDSS